MPPAEPALPADTARAGGAFAADLAERTGMTTIQVAAGLAVTEALGVPVGWAILVAAGLALVKGLVARLVGRKDSASLVPAVVAVVELPAPQARVRT